MTRPALHHETIWWRDVLMPHGIDEGTLTAPFPYFGGKRRVAPLVWTAFGDVVNYVEPFFGSGAMLLGRPAIYQRDNMRETVNDLDGYVANFWRAVQADPDEVARWADWPVSEVDLTARHRWLSNQREGFRARLVGDPEWFDAKVAGWWVWGISQWIGSGWADAGRCNGKAPEADGAGERGLAKDARGQVPEVNGCKLGRGVMSAARGKLPYIDGENIGKGVHGSAARTNLTAMMRRLSHRLRFTRIVSGDWSRVLTNTPMRPTAGPHTGNAFTGVFLDPPYDTGHDLYAEGHRIASDVRAWCIENGNDPAYRIALCGFDGEHNELEHHGWRVVAWKAGGGYNIDKSDAFRERIWFNPACLPLEKAPATLAQPALF